MVNITISISETLKSKMETHSDVNWSKVCREAIDTYIRVLENPYPEIKVELREVRFGYDKGKPGIRLDLSFKNEMKTQLVLDRMLFEVDFIPTPETSLSVGSGVEMNKRNVPMGKWAMIPFMEINPDTILSLDFQLKRTFQCSAHITAFFEDFKEPYTTSHVIKVPIDEWRRFVEDVVKHEILVTEIKRRQSSKYRVKM